METTTFTCFNLVNGKTFKTSPSVVEARINPLMCVTSVPMANFMLLIELCPPFIESSGIVFFVMQIQLTF